MLMLKRIYVHLHTKSPYSMPLLGVVDKADNKVVVIDTAPTGHTLLLLEFHRATIVSETDTGGHSENVKKLLPRLRNEKETGHYRDACGLLLYMTMRLEEDLKRAEISTK